MKLLRTFFLGLLLLWPCLAQAQMIDGEPAAMLPAFRSNRYNGNNIFGGFNTFNGVVLHNGAATFNALSTFNADVIFKSGRPWVDPRAYGAVCNGATNDTVALQNAINAADALGGANVLIPAGCGPVTSTLTVAQATCLIGYNGGSATGISSITSNIDITVVSFAASKAGACFYGVNIFGFMNAAAVNPTVLVNLNSAVHMTNCTIWGGVFALRTAGVDGRIRNCYIAGWGTSGGGIDSTGANFWTDNKIDQGIVATAFGFHQGTCAGSLCENHFLSNDLSGSYSVASFLSDDGGTSRNVNIHIGTIFSNAVTITNARVTSLTAVETGGAISSAAPLAITGSYAFTATTATGAGTRSCSANINITC